MNSQPAINLHIEELVLHGFAPGERHDIRAAVEQELTRLLTEQNISRPWQRSQEIERVNGGSFRAVPEKHSVGNQIAGAIHQAISQ